MATLNFPTPDLNDPATLTYTQAGITWTWNNTLEVWSSDLEGGSGGGGVPGEGVSVEVGETAPGSPSDGDLWFCTAEAADGGGRLYVYYQDLTSNQWVDVSQPGTGIEYLSKTGDDTAAGAITFEGVTTHEGGVLITGQTEFSDLGPTLGSARPDQLYVGFDGAGLRINKEGTTTINAQSQLLTGIGYVGLNIATVHSENATTSSATGIRQKPEIKTDLDSYRSFSADGQDNTIDDGKTVGEYVGFFAAGNTKQDNATISIGFKSSLNGSGGEAYNIYAQGNAWNWLRGNTFIGNANPVEMQTASTTSNCTVFGGVNKAITVIGQTAGTGTYRDIFGIFGYDTNLSETVSDAKKVGYIQMARNNCIFDAGPGGQFTKNSDYRLKENITPLSSAVDAVKALNPVSFNFTNGDPTTYEGFIAHELQEVNSSYATGTKDEVEAIGTFTDPDGVVSTEVSEPEAIPYGATWEQTGTRNKLQGVDHGNLVPLLTKALQEVIAENEDIKARLAALEGA